MNKEFVTYEQAVELKKLLYGEHYGDDYLAWYSSNKDFHYRNMNSPVYPNNQSFIAPLKQQVFRWFREMYGAHIHPRRILPNVYIAEYGLWTSEAFKTYEEAENACIDKLIEIAKQQDTGTSD
jgi:hypothetical protein